MDDPQFKLTKANLPIPSNIEPAILKHLASLYGRVLLACPQQKRHTISPAELQRLDELRYRTLPEAIQERRDADLGIDVSFGKPELQDLVEWKLARGIYRPTLNALIASNDDESVVEITTEAFREFAHSTPDTQLEKAQNSVKTLCELRGVGPATASLLASVAHPDFLPFFSDELYYWLYDNSKGLKLEKIKYNMAEYKQILSSVQEIRDRLDKEYEGGPPRADDIERAAFVIQKFQNPDIWKAVLGDKEDEVKAIVAEKKQDPKAGKEELIAGFDESVPPTEEKSELNAEEKAEEIEEKKEILIEHGAKVKSTKKRSRAPEDSQPTRRSSRVKKT